MGKDQKRNTLLSAGNIQCRQREEKELVLLARNGSNEARNQLIASSMKIVSDHLLKWSRETGYEIDEDMMQEANLAMLGTIDRFVKGKSNPSFYRLSLRTSVRNALDEMARSQGSPFSLKEDRSHTRSSIKSPDALILTLYGEDEEGACETPWGYCIPHPETAACSQEARERILEILECLPEAQRYVVKKSFGLDGDGTEMTLQELAELMGLNRARVRQLEAVALRSLRDVTVSWPLRGYL